jgi:hypothetical protein
LFGGKRRLNKSWFSLEGHGLVPGANFTVPWRNDVEVLFGLISQLRHAPSYLRHGATT